MAEKSPSEGRVTNPFFVEAMQALQHSGISTFHSDAFGFGKLAIEMGIMKTSAESTNDANKTSSSYKVTGEIVKIDDKATAAVSVLDLFNPVMPEDKILLERLGLSTRTQNILKGAGINSLGDLMKLYRKDVTSIRYIGAKRLVEVETGMAKFLSNLIDTYTK